MSRDQQIALFGSDQAAEPPDTQLAAGPTQLMEMDNNSLSIWSKLGGRLVAGDLNSFFPVPVSNGYRFSDPRVLYDAQSMRWLASGISVDQAHDSQVYVAVSLTADATGSWYLYIMANYSGIVGDQPKPGVNDDKVVLSWNDIRSDGSFGGSETRVLQKSALLSGGSLVSTAFGPGSLDSIVPSQSLTATTTEWLSSNKHTGQIALIAINGTPAQSNVTWTEYDLPVGSTQIPPSAVQPSGPPIATNDDRLLSAVWRGGVLWTSGNDGCLPPGESTDRACLLLIQVATTGTPALLQDHDVYGAGADLYFPAVTVDGYGDLFVAYSRSSAQMYASVFALHQLVNAPNSLGSSLLVQPGQGTYGPVQRWGDYSAAAVDPTNNADVWVTGEYAGSSTNPSDWGTATASVAVRPVISSINPSSGPANGSQGVAITGSYFQSGATLSFGSGLASGVSVTNGTQITATTPPGYGAVDVTVTNPDGGSGSAASAYTYWESLSGSLSSAPDAASWSTGRLDVFARGANNDLQHKWYVGGWSDWESLGGQMTSGPGVVAWGPGRLDVFVRGTDNALWHKWYAGGWSVWESLGGQLSSSPDAASWASGRLDVVVRGIDNALWHKWYAGGWSVWESLGGLVTADPSAVSWSTGRLDLFVRGTDNGLWHKWYASGWNGWEPLGGDLGSGPDAASSADSRLDVLALAADTSAQRKSFGGQWGGWRNVGGQWTSDPSAVSQHHGTVEVFERDSGNNLWHTTLPSP